MGDRSPGWKVRHAFYGKPWIWNVLYNFGGKVSVNGDLPQIAANLDTAIRSPDKERMEGLGMTMEGLGTNPIVPDFVFDQVWRDTVPDVNAWTRSYVTRRYGRYNASAWSAWQLLLATASLLAGAPTLGGNDAYRYDVVNLTRQVLGQLGLPLVNQLQAAYEEKNRTQMVTTEHQIESLLRDIDTLVGTRQEFLLGRWIADAKRWGTTDAERRLYEWNARNIITLWGTKCTEGQNDDLNLYAFKEWEGMLPGYFLPRWEAFFKDLNASLANGKPFDRAPFAAASCEWEQKWSHGTTPTFRTEPVGDPVETAERLVKKWRAH